MLLLPHLAAADEIKALSRGGMAPFTFHVQATDLKLKSGTELDARFEWDFGDEGSKFNKLRGFNAAHIYEKPGTYATTLKWSDASGEREPLKIEVNVLADNRRKIYVSLEGNDSNDGASPEHPVKTWERIKRSLDDNVTILLRRGDVFDVATTMEIKNTNIVIGAYEASSAATSPSALPVLRFVGPLKYLAIFSTNPGSAALTVENIEFDSNSPANSGKKGLPDCFRPGGVNLTVRNCSFLNVGYGFNGNRSPRGILAQENVVPLPTGLRSYFGWVQGSDWVFLGNSVVNSVHEHDIRIAGAQRILISHNALSNPSKQVPGDNALKGTITVHKGDHVFITDNQLKFGKLSIGPLGEKDGLKHPEDRFAWAVVENNLIDSPIIIEHGASHVMIRNNILKRTGYEAIIIEGFDKTYNRGVSDVTIANNTAINDANKGNFLEVDGPAERISLTKNLYVAPNLECGGPVGSAPVSVAQSDLSSFTAITGNVWPNPAKRVGDGVNLLGPKDANESWTSPEKWTSMSPVKGDFFENVTLDEKLNPKDGRPEVKDVGARLSE